MKLDYKQLEEAFLKDAAWQPLPNTNHARRCSWFYALAHNDLYEIKLNRDIVSVHKMVTSPTPYAANRRYLWRKEFVVSFQYSLFKLHTWGIRKLWKKLNRDCLNSIAVDEKRERVEMKRKRNELKEELTRKINRRKESV